MHFTTAAIAAAGLIAHQVLATGSYGGGWGGSGYYSTPDNTNNECSPAQSNGYNWSGLNDGSFDNYGSNKFSGWSCKNSLGKRDSLTKREFQSKCIAANLDKEPAISCHDDKTMSLDKFEVSADQDADIECHYTMPDESICKEVHSCSAGGTVIQNSQCGGAKSVKFKPAGDSKGKGCNIGVHSVGFNCGSASSAPPSYSSTASPASSTPTSVAAVEETTSTPTTPASVTFSSESYSSPTTPAYGSSNSSVATYTAGTSTTQCGYGSTQSVPASASSTVCVAIPINSSTENSPVTTYSSQSAPVFTQSTAAYVSSNNESITTYAPSLSTGGSPVTTVSASSYSPAIVPSNGTYSAPSVSTYAPTPSTGGSPVTTVPTSSYSTAVVSSNGTYSATSVPTYGSSVQGIPAYSSSSEVPAVTNVPSNSAPATETSAVPTYEGPKPQSPNVLPKCLNTWLHLTTCKDNSDYSCFCKNAKFVKQVYQCVSSWSTTDDDTTSGASYLMGICAQYIPENPAVITACPSTVTPAGTFSYPTASSYGGSPVESSVKAYSPHTVTIYSTKVATITSCGPEVTNCPASTQYTSYAIATTVSTPEAPLNTAPAPSSPESSPVGPFPIASSPAPTAPASVPCTTITYSTQYPVPAIYSTGVSQGATIPSSSTITTLITTVTVPQVQITTYAITQGSSTVQQPGLGYGTPNSPAGATSGPAYSAAPSGPGVPPVGTASAPVYSAAPSAPATVLPVGTASAPAYSGAPSGPGVLPVGTASAPAYSAGPSAPATVLPVGTASAPVYSAAPSAPATVLPVGTASEAPYSAAPTAPAPISPVGPNSASAYSAGSTAPAPVSPVGVNSVPPYSAAPTASAPVSPVGVNSAAPYPTGPTAPAPVSPVGINSAPPYPVGPTAAAPASASAPYPTTSAAAAVGPLSNASSGFGTTYAPAPSHPITPYAGAGAKTSISGLAVVAVVGVLFF